jgi:thioredoxin-dependent peroxiredoxin
MATLEGEMAPDFSLAGSDGRTHSLKDYAGKTVIIYFYPRDNTSGCSKEACTFRDLHGELQNLDVTVLGVSKDSLASHDKFIAKFGLPFVLLSDPDTTMMQAYGAFGEKKHCGKVSQGTIRSTVVVGPDGRVLKHWPTVKKAETHPHDILEFLQSR